MSTCLYITILVHENLQIKIHGFMYDSIENPYKAMVPGNSIQYS